MLPFDDLTKLPMPKGPPPDKEALVYDFIDSPETRNRADYFPSEVPKANDNQMHPIQRPVPPPLPPPPFYHNLPPFPGRPLPPHLMAFGRSFGTLVLTHKVTHMPK